MDWIKKNLGLVLTGLGILAAIGAAGFFFYTRMLAEQEVETQLITLRDTLSQLQNKVPFPAEENVQAAIEQEKELQAFKAKAERFFKTDTNPPVKTDAEFGYLLLRTLARLQKMAQAYSVTLPTNFYFGFTVQKDLLQYDTNTMSTISAQLADIDTLCQILFQARIYELLSIKRAAVSTNDTAAVEGTTQDPQNLPVKDYLTNRKITTNQTVKAVISPYELTFKCTTAELAAAIEGIIRAPVGILVKYIKVDPADTATEEGSLMDTMGRTTYATRSGGMSAADMRRYGFSNRGPMGRPPGRPTPAPAPGPGDTFTTAPAAPKKPGTVLKEKPLRVSMYVEVVKLMPPPPAVPNVPAADRASRMPTPPPTDGTTPTVPDSALPTN